MTAVVTGASSGIGYQMALILAKKGYDLILVARRTKKLEKLKKELKTNTKIITLDLSIEENCYKLYDQTKDDNVTLLVNNAGFGNFGEFNNTSLSTDINMINVNVKAVHILTKLYLKDFVNNNSGHILNVASIAAFSTGPLMATYYATKAYVLHMTEAINEELRRNKSKVVVSCLCPGPVTTEFNKVAKVSFNLKSLTPEYVANYALKKLFDKKRVIIPGFRMKSVAFFVRLVPRSLISRVNYKLQSAKQD